MAAALVAVLAAACYVNTLGADFVNWDDYKLVVRNEYVHGLSGENLKAIWSAPIRETYLPLRATSYAVDHAIWGLDPTGYHLTNILLHIVVCLLVLGIARRLTGSAAAGLAAGILFAVHPVHTEAVAWVSGRKDVLSTALFLWAYLLYLQARRQRGPHWGFVAASLVVFLFAGLAKAMVVTLPVFVVLTDFIFGEAIGGGRWKRLVGVWAAYFAVAAVITAIAVYFASSAGAVRSWHFGGMARTALFMSWVVLFYVKTMIWPNFLSARYPYGDGLEYGVAESTIWASPAVLVLVLAGALWLVWRGRGGRSVAAPLWVKLGAFGVAWFFVGIGPVMNIVPINVLVADRYLYLPSVGAVFAAAALFSYMWTAGRARRAIALAVFVALAAAGVCRTYVRNGVWKDSVSLWTSVVGEFPESAEARILLASAYAGARPAEYEKALAEIDAAASLMEGSAEPHVARAKVLFRMDRSKEAFEELLRAEELMPASAEPHFARGEFLLEMGRRNEAFAEFALAHYNDARLAAEKGNYKTAIEYYKRALQADASFVDAVVGLAEAYRATGDYQAARREAVRALELDGGNEKAQNLKDDIDRLTEGGG